MSCTVAHEPSYLVQLLARDFDVVHLDQGDEQLVATGG